jgi:hypothetical protein
MSLPKKDMRPENLYPSLKGLLNEEADRWGETAATWGLMSERRPEAERVTIVQEMARLLADGHNPRAIDIARQLPTEPPAVRREIVRVLDTIGGSFANSVVRVVAAEDPDPSVVRVATQTLARNGLTRLSRPVGISQRSPAQ